MNRLARFSFSLGAALTLTAGISFADGPKPIRHLVYNFDVSISTDHTQHVSGIGSSPGGGGPSNPGASSGVVDNVGGTSDQGTIAVDVLQVQPDTGLVVQISEQARNNRDAVPTMCVVYGNSAVICDQTHGQLNEEESSLLRFLGRNFVNPATIDSHDHWRYSASDSQSQETSDFTLGKAVGDSVPVVFQRVLKVSGVNGFNATTDGTLTYNRKMSVPVQIKEDTTTRKQSGAGDYDTTRAQLTLTLQNDSLTSSVP
jgi:hypothetical protein